MDWENNGPKIPSKRDLGGSWAPFGKGLGRSGPTFGNFCDVFWSFWALLNKAFFKHGSKIRSRRAFGLILGGFSVVLARFSGKVLGGFWDGLERIWEGLGKIWALKIEAFASHGRLLSTVCVPCCLTLCYSNPRAASLRPAERHNLLPV